VNKLRIVKIGFISLAFSLSSSTSSAYVFTPMHALTPMPTSIDMTNLSDASVSAYYQGVEGTSGDQLLEALHDIIKDHNEYDYESSTHRTIYKIIDRNWELSPLNDTQLSNFNYETDNPYIRKLYADYNDAATTADLFKNDGASRVSFDKEHIWAQSLGNFGRTGGAGSDFHALWPSDVRGNQNAHSNYNFATPTSGITNYNNDYGTYVGRNGYIVGSSQKVFEPLDQYKGDIARAMFYMPARYYVYEDVLHPKLLLVNGSPLPITASPSQPGLAGDLATLLTWHELDPVDEHEIRRNNLLYNNYQGNRNPFIDYPQWARIAYDESYVGEGASRALGTSTAAGLPEPAITLDRIEVALVDDSNKFYLFDNVAKSDLIVTAFYSDATSMPVVEYTLSIAGQDNLTFSSIGPHELLVSYTDNAVTKTATLTVEVELSAVQMIIAGAIGLTVIGVIFAIPSLRKKIISKAKKTIKKPSSRKKQRSTKK